MAEFTPGIVIGPDGQEQVSYDHGTYTDTEYKNTTNRQHQLEQDNGDDFVYDPETDSYRHRFADYNPDEFIQQEDTYVEEHSAYDEFAQAELPEADQEYLQGIAGGAEAYGQMMTWAGENLSEEDQLRYDHIMGSNDVEMMQNMIAQLFDIYKKSGGHDQYMTEQRAERDAEYQEYHARPQETSEREVQYSADLIDSIHNSVGGEATWNKMVEFADNNFEQDDLDWIVNELDTQDPERVLAVTNALHSMWLDSLNW